jgi:hypothetical protein
MHDADFADFIFALPVKSPNSLPALHCALANDDKRDGASKLLEQRVEDQGAEWASAVRRVGRGNPETTGAALT